MRWRVLMIIVLTVFILYGCGTGSSTSKPDKQPMQGWQKQVTESKQDKQDDTIQELNHWKYGAKPGDTLYPAND